MNMMTSKLINKDNVADMFKPGKPQQRKTFRQFYMEAGREYNYEIRLLDECNEGILEMLEKGLGKYDLTKFSQPTSTGFVTNPRGFNAPHGEVHIIEVTTRLPMPVQARNMLATKMGLPESHVSILSENDPALEVDSMISHYNHGGTEGAKLNDPDYSESIPIDHKDFYGEEFKSGFLEAMLADLKSRETHVNKYMGDLGQEEAKANEKNEKIKIKGDK